MDGIFITFDYVCFKEVVYSGVWHLLIIDHNGNLVQTHWVPASNLHWSEHWLSIELAMFTYSRKYPVLECIYWGIYQHFFWGDFFWRYFFRGDIFRDDFFRRDFFFQKYFFRRNFFFIRLFRRGFFRRNDFWRYFIQRDSILIKSNTSEILISLN